jgi:hypothetical protein
LDHDARSKIESQELTVEETPLLVVDRLPTEFRITIYVEVEKEASLHHFRSCP